MDSPPIGFSWTDHESEGEYWELRPRRGKHVAEVVKEGSTGRWLWYVHLPPEWLNGRNPSGAAKSCEAAKAICNAIIVHTM
jgi:hypothetical protein